MKLKIEEFELFAKEHGYSSGGILIKSLGGRKRTYSCLRRGLDIGYELAREIYNAFGAGGMLKVIDLGSETLQGFESKYVKVGELLF